MDAEQWLTAFFDKYSITPNVVYRTVDEIELKLDLYTLREPNGPNPALVYFHGGGWGEGSKEGAILWGLLPYMVRGWSLVNVGYRLARIQSAPAAVEDCLSALGWVFAHAEEYLFDTKRIITTGFSAGGHLALITGMLAAFMDLKGDLSLNHLLPANPIQKSPVAAIINWYGITDVADMLEGRNARLYARQWLSGVSNQNETAQRVSPINYVKSGIPPIISIHGDADPSVPYNQATSFHEALNRQGITNTLVTVPGGGHCYFGAKENTRVFGEIWKFLEETCSIH